jgi:hypothetical protein
VQKWERAFIPNSLAKLDAISAASLRQAMRDISLGWKLGKVLTYDTLIIWLVDEVGDIWFAVEELVVDELATGRPKHQRLKLTTNMPKLGHPALNNCAKARIAGEIYFDSDDSPVAWVINNNSGRYGRHPSRVPEHLNNAANEFKRYDIDLIPFFLWS